MISQKMQDAINEQINEELFSGYLYYSMSAYFESINLPGFAHWMRVQALEEQEHAHRFYNYLTERGGDVKLAELKAPKTEWSSPLNAFEEAYKHEQHITGRINKLMDMAQEGRDHASVNFLQWFVAEQVEEEATADDAVQRLKLVEDSKGGLFMMDKEMGARAFTLSPEVTF